MLSQRFSNAFPIIQNYSQEDYFAELATEQKRQGVH